MASGIVVATVKSHFVSLAQEQNLCLMLDKISDGIRNMGLKTTFMGLLAWRYNPGTEALLEYCSAGMPPFFIYRASTQQVELLITKSMPLGTRMAIGRRREKLSLQAGDTVLFISDGFMELFDKNRNQLGLERIQKQFERCATQSPEAIIADMQALAKSWSAEQKPNDDITL
ncbi:PP2C family protein-serine/threonine phosphatase, partial [Arthrospira platensis SPKY1]|nr:PP2C family protein-serine/threonine phosphatase [Arthrospira platensis SPKY1]